MESLVLLIDDILNDELTLQQRGILITLLLVKEKDKKLTLAKFKAKVKYSKILEDLVFLQDKDYLKFSGYNAAKKSLKGKSVCPKVIEAIDFMNNLYGRGFQASSKATTSSLSARLKENDLESIKGVISNRWERWSNDPVMKSNLNPTTIFREKNFAKYLEDYLTTKVGSGAVSVNKINLKDGDTINKENVFELSETESYNVQCFELNAQGNRLGKPIKMIVTGQRLQRMIKTEIDNIKFGGYKTKEYIYKKL